MRDALLILVLISLAFGAWPAIADLKRGRVPTTVGFATLSVVVFYGLGILLELFDVPYTIAFFNTFRATDSEHWMAASAILATTPWLLIVGGKLAKGSSTTASSPWSTASSTLVRETQTVFYSLSLASAALCAWVGLRYMLNSNSIWTARSSVSGDFGALIVVLYLPLHLLAFFSTQRDAQSGRGLFFLVLMALAMVGSTLAIGERTNALLPVMVILLFRRRPSLAKVGLSVAVLFCVASILLPIFKPGYNYDNKSNSELLVLGFAGDVARGPLLLESLERSELVGTRTLPFPMAGYWYSLQFFVPRSVAVAKGSSTSAYFTGAVVNEDPARLDWGFGIGFVEEIVLNAGILAVFPGMLLYGFALGKLDRLSNRWSVLVPSTRLAAFWMAGYHLPALLLTFAPMAGVALLCGACFASDKAGIVPAKRWARLNRGGHNMHPAAAWAGRR
jgi:hypothetical protein